MTSGKETDLATKSFLQWQKPQEVKVEMGSVNGNVMQVPQKQGLEVRLHLGLAENIYS